MCTILKVKRKIDENPVDRLIIECKKQRINLTNDDVKSVSAPLPGAAAEAFIKQIFQYVGTAQTENDVPEKLREINKKLKTKTELQDEYKAKTTTLIDQQAKSALIEELKKEHKTQRYVLLNKKRGLDDQELNDNLNIIDIVSSDYLNEQNIDIDKSRAQQDDEITCNEKPLIKEQNVKKADFIYDIYYTKSDQIHLDLLYSNAYTITPFYEDLIFDNDKEDEEEKYYHQDDDEDSNAEEHWRNEYPDEGDEYNEYDGEYGYDEYGYDLSGMMKKSCGISYYNENDSDIDDYDDEDDKCRPARSYNSYKKRILRELEHDGSDSD